MFVILQTYITKIQFLVYAKHVISYMVYNAQRAIQMFAFHVFTHFMFHLLHVLSILI